MGKLDPTGFARGCFGGLVIALCAGLGVIDQGESLVSDRDRSRR